MVAPPPRSPLFPYTTLFRSHDSSYKHEGDPRYDAREVAAERARRCGALLLLGSATPRPESVRRLPRSEEHTSELQSHSDLVCRLLLEKKKKKTKHNTNNANM